MSRTSELRTHISGKIGLIGNPVAHSLSPAFQQPAFDYFGLPVYYELWKTEDDAIGERIEQLRSGEIYGANVTVPHKERFFALVDDCSSVAVNAQAINTIVVREGRLVADNTDVYGFLQSLDDEAFTFNGAKVMIIGAGGAARGLVAGLTSRDIGSITIANRTLSRAELIANDFQGYQIDVCDLERAPELADDADLLVNATAIGWEGERFPVSTAIFQSLSPDAIAYDLTYRQTSFLDAAMKAGIKTVDGLGMLVHQGAKSFEIWTGREAPFEVMWSAALAARDQ